MCQKNECCLIEAGYWINKEKHQFTRNKMLNYNELDEFVESKNHKGVFCTAYKYNTKIIEEAYLYGDLYFDFDSKDNFELVREDAIQVISYLKIVFRMEHDQCKIYFSGNKGVHIIVSTKSLGVEPDKKLNGVYKYIAENIRDFTPNKTLDLAIYDNKRLFRIPGTIHESTNLFKIPITYDELRNLSSIDIRKLAMLPRTLDGIDITINRFANTRYKEYLKQYYLQKDRVVNVSYKSKLTCTPPCISYLLEKGASEGNRNNTIAALASFYKSKGEDLINTIDLLNDWNLKSNSPPTSKGELDKTVKSIYYGKTSYGCSTLKNISLCNEIKCPLKKKGGKN